MKSNSSTQNTENDSLINFGEKHNKSGSTNSPEVPPKINFNREERNNINKSCDDENYPPTRQSVPKFSPELGKHVENKMKFSFTKVIEDDLNLTELMEKVRERKGK